MIAYLLKFILCSGLLLLVYRAFLGSERLYRFNRFYLLFSLAFSLMVPAITIHVPYMNMPALGQFFEGKPVVIDQQPVAQTGVSLDALLKANKQIQTPMADRSMDMSNNDINNGLTGRPVYIQNQSIITPAPKPERNYLPEILLALYAVGALLLLFRFVRNSYRITRLINESTVIDYQDTKLVLVKDDVTPHSFLKYVFLNKDAYRNKTIEPEIICHEQTHVRQLHSLDVIWVELFQVACWFNPFIPLYRKAIQLNHEFLADEAVIENYNDTPAYQYLLLAKASQSGGLSLTSQFNYLVTKKRLIMMTKSTTAAIALYKRLALVPVLAVVLFLFSQKIMAQNTPKAKPVSKPKVAPKVTVKPEFNTAIEAAKQDAPQSLLDEYSTILAKYHIPYKQGEKINYAPEFSTADKERLTALYKQMSAKQQQHQYVRLGPLFPPPLIRFTIDDTVNLQNKTIYVNDKKVVIAELSKYGTTLGYVTSIKESKRNEVRLNTRAYYKKYSDNLPKMHFFYIPKKSWKYTNWRIGGAIPIVQQAQVKFEGPEPAFAQNDAPQSVLDEYAAIEKKYCFYSLGKDQKLVAVRMINISDEDRQRLIALYEQMSKAQQQKQSLKFAAIRPPMPKIIPSEHDLNNWKNSSQYGVWINDKKIKNEELSKYKAADFDYYSVSFLYPNARVHVKYHYQVNLMTKADYAQFRAEQMALAKKNKYALTADFKNFQPEINASAQSVTQKDALNKKM